MCAAHRVLFFLFFQGQWCSWRPTQVEEVRWKQNEAKGHRSECCRIDEWLKKKPWRCEILHLTTEHEHSAHTTWQGLVHSSHKCALHAMALWMRPQLDGFQKLNSPHKSMFSWMNMDTVDSSQLSSNYWQVLQFLFYVCINKLQGGDVKFQYDLWATSSAINLLNLMNKGVMECWLAVLQTINQLTVDGLLSTDLSCISNTKESKCCRWYQRYLELLDLAFECLREKYLELCNLRTIAIVMY